MQAATVQNVSRLYGSFAALRRVTHSFAAGGFHVLLGPNGAGKSTLLRVLAGLVSPSSGSVEVLGGDPHSVRSRMAYMSHAPMLYEELSAMENLRYFSRLSQPGATCDCSGSPEMALRAVGLDPAMTRPVSQFSQGMRQRVSMARALVADPELLLLDEPFSNMDVGGARELVALLLDFRSWPLPGGRAARTVIMTTHQFDLVQDVADSVVTMRNGAIADEATPGLKPLQGSPDVSGLKATASSETGLKANAPSDTGLKATASSDDGLKATAPYDIGIKATAPSETAEAAGA